MAGNVIFRGPVGGQPESLSTRTVAGAYLPGILCTDSGTVLTVAAAADIDKDLVILANRDFAGQDVATAYASGDTAVAYRPVPGEKYQVRLAAATYAVGAQLTVGASGYLEAAASGERVLAYFDDTAGAFAAGALADVRITSFDLA
jgi:hypothetical protein